MQWKDKIIDYVLLHSGGIISGIVIFIVGLFVARSAAKVVGSFLERKGFEPPLRSLITKAVRLLVLALATLIALQTCGIDLLPLIAGISVVGVGVGLAMQGVLGNLVAGLSIIFTKPFKVGEYVELLGVHGQVIEIELFTTKLVHADKSRVVIPNRKIVGEILHNYGTIRQLNVPVNVSYGTDINQALTVVREIMARNPRVLKDPVPVVGVSELADSSIVITASPWVSVVDFGPAMAELTQAIAERFREMRIEIPFPQREIRILEKPTPAAQKI